MSEKSDYNFVNALRGVLKLPPIRCTQRTERPRIVRLSERTLAPELGTDVFVRIDARLEAPPPGQRRNAARPRLPPTTKPFQAGQ